MKKHLTFIFFFSLIAKCFGQVNCNCGAMIDIDFKNKISILDKPNGNVVKKLKHNFEEEDYLVLTIEKDTVDYFKVNISYSIEENTNVIGWVKKDSNIGTFTKNYSPNEKLKLYSAPNKKSKVNSIVPNWIKQLFVIKKCSGKWVYVKVKYMGKIKEGWLEPEMQCDNPYSNCN